MNPWYRSPQTWNAYGLEWEFNYSELNAKRTITAEGFTLDVPIVDPSYVPVAPGLVRGLGKEELETVAFNICVAFISNLDSLSTAHIKAQGKLI